MTALTAQLDSILSTAMTGSIVRTEGLAAAVAGLPAPVGAVVEIERLADHPIEAEVIGFRGREIIVYPLGEMTGVRRGDRVRLRRTRRTLRVGTELLGRVIDAAVQIHGGYGVSKEFPLERWYREARVRRIGEGPSEVHRMVIARSLFR